MKIKVADKTYDSKEQPVMVILNRKDRENIRGMDPGATTYCSFPKGTKQEDIIKWMNERAEP